MKKIQESDGIFKKIKSKAKEFAAAVKIMFTDMSKYMDDKPFMEKLLAKFKTEGTSLNLTNEERLVAVAIIAESSSPFGKPEEDLKYKLACMICDKEPLVQEAKNMAWAILSAEINNK